MAQACTQHPDSPAMYQCDGCGKLLCESCITESRVLLLCNHCGERALPLDAAQPSSVQELKRRRAVSRPYTFGEALKYPFRGSGPIMLALVVIGGAALAFALFMVGATILVGGCYWLVLFLAASLFYWGMVIGLQFKIARTTANGETELPDWPDFFDTWSLFLDILTWVVIHAIPLGVGLWIALTGGFFSREPHFGFWLAVAIVLWLGSGLAAIGYGAVGNYGRVFCFTYHLHLRAFFAAGKDSLTVTNLVFGLGALVMILQGVLQAVPVLGTILSGIVGGYWLFVEPHLAGMIFRRSSEKLDRIYLAHVV